jgi:hypothetical protein
MIQNDGLDREDVVQLGQGAMGRLKHFTVFVQENLQKNKIYYPNILVQIIVKKLFLFPIILLEYFASFTIF